MTPFEEMMHRIVGCQWGRLVSMPSDIELCTERAVQIVALHPAPGAPDYVLVRLCQRHLDTITAHSTPTQEVPT